MLSDQSSLPSNTVLSERRRRKRAEYIHDETAMASDTLPDIFYSTFRSLGGHEKAVFHLAGLDALAHLTQAPSRPADVADFSFDQAAMLRSVPCPML